MNGDTRWKLFRTDVHFIALHDALVAAVPRVSELPFPFAESKTEPLKSPRSPSHSKSVKDAKKALMSLMKKDQKALLFLV